MSAQKVLCQNFVFFSGMESVIVINSFVNKSRHDYLLTGEHEYTGIPESVWS
uniref:Uncharacterized protein n=1 Tax=Arion vulgaris TaxID=1028688 RepID=A0A0B6ZMT1_9EUPU